MIRQNYECDRCKAVGKGNPPLTLSVWGAERTEQHLCSDCLLALVRWIEAGT